MKTKTLVLIGIAVCALLLTSPALASAGYSKIYGNANEDDVLDMRDVTYLKLVIFGKKPATDFADANYDGKISMLDVGQAKLIILGKEKQLTLIDQADRVVTINKPIENAITAGLLDGVRAMIHLGAADKLVGVSDWAAYGEDKFAGSRCNLNRYHILTKSCPELEELPCTGSYTDPNLELMASLDPDVIFTYSQVSDVANSIQDSIGVPVVCISGSKGYLDFELHTLVGEVIGKEKEAEELISYANEELDEVTEVTSEIPDSEKPRVYLAFWVFQGDITYTPTYYDPTDLAGGINVAGGIGGDYRAEIPKEQIIVWNPDIILIHPTCCPITTETVRSDPDLQTVNAVKDRRVYYTPGYFLGWDQASGIVETVYMAKLFHPDRFGDRDVTEKNNKILKRFYGVDGLWSEIADACEYYTWD